MIAIRIVFSFMLFASSSAMTCSDAVLWLSSWDQECPRQCDGEGDESLPKCNPGQNERAASICGTDKCGDLIASIEDATLKSAIEGFESCASDPNMKVYATYASYGADYLSMALQDIAFQCEHDDKVKLSKLDGKTCIGAMMVIGDVNKRCPRQCKSPDDDDENGLPVCSAGQEERAPSSCGTDQCGAFLAALDDDAVDSMMLGFKACESHAHFSHAAAYASHGKDYIKMMLVDLGSKCGKSDKLKLSKPGPDTCGGAMGMIMGMDGNCPRGCKSEDDDDAPLPMCAEGAEERTKSSCGTDQCAAFVASLTDAAIDTMVVGFKDCKKNPATAQYAAYGDSDGFEMKMGIRHIAKACGVPSPTSAPSTTTAPPTTSAEANSAVDADSAGQPVPAVAMIAAILALKLFA